MGMVRGALFFGALLVGAVTGRLRDAARLGTLSAVWLATATAFAAVGGGLAQVDGQAPAVAAAGAWMAVGASLLRALDTLRTNSASQPPGVTP